VLFNSYIFIFAFLPITLIIYFFLAKKRWINAAVTWLAMASLFFYAYWNPIYLILLLISIGINFITGKILDRAAPQSQQAKLILIGGITINIAILAYYKYTIFLIKTINQLFTLNLALPHIILPLAISFHTFTQIAYLVDIYRRDIKNHNYDIISYILFIAFYPQLIAGPILRHYELIPELQQAKTYIFSYKNFAKGLTIFIIGLGKKVLIADNLSLWVTPIFKHIEQLSFVEAWLGALSYTFQLYFDFSGYSDMAVGLGLMTNIKIPINFNSPYKSTSIIDFWRRWHITLSNFLRDYLYIPLGGNRKGELRRYFNLIITMLLGGLWHGAGWSYVVWGGMQGLFLSANQFWRKLNIKMPSFLAWLITFLAIVFSWVIFRASTLSEGLTMLQTMLGMKGIILPIAAKGPLLILADFGIEFRKWRSFPYLPILDGPLTIMIITGLIFTVTKLPNTQEIMANFKPSWQGAILVSTIFLGCLLSLTKVSEFLYFQF
jgi:alginate O-acetyltransferase complex protein AlgI